jgi:acetylornithine aminotransferase
MKAPESLPNPHVLQNYNRYTIEFVSGIGKQLFDAEGKSYLDFLSGIAVTSFGHQHPVIKSAVEKQLSKIWHTSNLFQISLQESVAASLCEASGLDAVFFCNSGTEANEAAIKFARKWGNGRYEIIATDGSFHGRTMGALSATGQAKIQEGFAPVLPGFVHVPYNDAYAIEKAITENTCAVLLEVIQGENGVVEANPEYVSKVREICNQHNLLLIIDEVQTGVGRTGKYFGYQWYGVQPDIVSFAKGIANGLPLGGVICTQSVAAAMKPGSHGSTFGGNHIALAAAEAVMQLLTPETLHDIESLGDLLIGKLKALVHPLIKTVRGKGLIIGVEIVEEVEVKNIAALLMEAGMVAGTAGNNTLRLLPPFIINQQDIEIFIDKLTTVLQTVSETADAMKGAESAH